MACGGSVGAWDRLRRVVDRDGLPSGILRLDMISDIRVGRPSGVSVSGVLVGVHPGRRGDRVRHLQSVGDVGAGAGSTEATGEAIPVVVYFGGVVGGDV